MIALLQKSPAYQDMLIIITYDENGGQWDHVAPPRRDKWGPGTRIPLIAVGPTVRRGFVDHTPYDFGSILRTVELSFGVEPLNDRDADGPDAQSAAAVTPAHSVRRSPAAWNPQQSGMSVLAPPRSWTARGLSYARSKRGGCRVPCVAATRQRCGSCHSGPRCSSACNALHSVVRPVIAERYDAARAWWSTIGARAAIHRAGGGLAKMRSSRRSRGSSHTIRAT